MTVHTAPHVALCSPTLEDRAYDWDTEILVSQARRVALHQLSIGGGLSTLLMVPSMDPGWKHMAEWQGTLGPWEDILGPSHFLAAGYWPIF